LLKSLFFALDAALILIAGVMIQIGATFNVTAVKIQIAEDNLFPEDPNILKGILCWIALNAAEECISLSF
jgi:hypothetical protein